MMKMKKLLVVMLAGVVLFLTGCSCETWTTFWGGDPEQKCAGHWRFKKEEITEPVEETVKNPCDVPMATKAMKSYPVGDDRGNAICLEKMAPTEVVKNEPFEYRIKVTNLTNMELHNVMVTDCVPENLTVSSLVPKAHKIEGGDIHWALGMLGPKDSRMITVSAVAGSEGDITSCAEVSYDSPICAQISVVEPKLQLAKFVPSESLMCDRIPVRYVVTNTGTGYACDIMIEEVLEKGFMTTEGKEQIMFNLASLGPGQSREFKTMLDATRSGECSSKAIAKSRLGGTVESNMTVTDVTRPILSISGTGPASKYVGRPVTYEITVSNKGDGVAKNTMIEATVPGGFRFDSATAGGRFSSYSPRKVLWSVGALEPNSSTGVGMTLSADRAGTLITEASAKAYCADAVSTSARTSISGIPGILLEVVDVSDPIEVGQGETYVITVTNQGSAPGTNIQIICLLEETVEYVSSSGPTVASVVGGQVSFAALSELAPGTQVKWRVNAKAVGSGDSRFRVTMSSDQLERLVEETEATTFYE